MSSKQYFEEVAHQWDKMRESFFSDAVREKALAVAGVQQGKLAADIGAGTGFITEGLVRKGLHVIAVDESAAMLETMKKKFDSTERIDYRVGEAQHLPLSSGSVDYVFANMYLHHVESPPEAISEMVRILKPGGKFVLTDLDEHQFEFLRQEHHDRWMGFRRVDIQYWLTQAGLKNVVVDCVGETCCAQSSSGCESASISVFIASGDK
jgi:ubiquinone/menaquinone biosynthesis C-methylase UbiE